MEPKRLRNILILLFIVLVFLFGGWYVYDYVSRKDEDKDDVEEVTTPLQKEQDNRNFEKQPAIEILGKLADSGVLDKGNNKPFRNSGKDKAFDPGMEIPKQEKTDKIPRKVEGMHKVREGENFSLVTGIYWKDIFLWPELYIHNSMASDDPDLIYPDEIITIYNRLGLGDTFSSRELSEILDAYIQVYKVYKKLGKEKNNSVWSLLWCASRYDHDFLERYKDQIDPEDIKMARKYIAEQGYLD